MITEVRFNAADHQLEVKKKSFAASLLRMQKTAVIIEVFEHLSSYPDVNQIDDERRITNAFTRIRSACENSANQPTPITRNIVPTSSRLPINNP